MFQSSFNEILDGKKAKRNSQKNTLKNLIETEIAMHLKCL